MVHKPSTRQQAQLEYFKTLPPKLDRIRRTIEAMAILQADEASVRALGRMLDEIKANCQQQGLHRLAETAGSMAMLSRRGGGQQVKVRGLRELLGNFQVNLEGAHRAALVPEADTQEKGPGA
ncbi:MAG TPA: hypothetical protein VFS74_09000 [Gemmatimonadales bacterium]|nr:hypothetical protein [Gemmatimonadales bacterium]